MASPPSRRRHGSPRLLLVVCLCGFFASPAWCVFNQHGKIRFSISCCSLRLVFNQEGSVVVPFTCFVIYRLVISPVGRIDIKVLFSVSSAALLSIVCLHPPISHRSIVSGHDSSTAQTSPVPTPQIDRPE